MKLPKAGAITTEIWKKWGRHVYEQEFEFPDGRKDNFFVFDTVNQTQPVIVFPITSDGEVIALRQFRTGANAVIYELPGGNPKPGQTAEEVLRAELLEETGYRPGRIVQFGQKKMWCEPASLRVSYIPLLALDCVFEKEPTPDQNELIEVVVMSFAEWVELIRKGEVEDDKSVALTYLAELYLSDEE